MTQQTLTLTAVVFAALVSAAHAEPRTSARAGNAVQLNDLNLRSETDAHRLLDRIEVAARDACNRGRLYGDAPQVVVKCREATIQQTIDALRLRSLRDNLHAARTLPQEWAARR